MINHILLPDEIIRLSKQIIPLREIYVSHTVRIPDKSAVYCFWWIDDKSIIENARRFIKVKGPKEKLVTIEYKFWHPKELSNIPLYIGKTTNLRNRISQHILLKEETRVYETTLEIVKPKPKTTSCQLRTGIEFILPNEDNPKKIILNNVGVSYVTIEGIDSISKRFYLEDLSIGLFKPWFNLDSER